MMTSQTRGILKVIIHYELWVNTYSTDPFKDNADRSDSLLIKACKNNQCNYDNTSITLTCIEHKFTNRATACSTELCVCRSDRCLITADRHKIRKPALLVIWRHSDKFFSFSCC